MTVPQLDHTVTDYRLEHAYWLAKAAELAYADEDESRSTTSGWGFDRFRFFHGTPDTSLPIQDPRGFVAVSENMIIVAFRGTEPERLKDWLSDSDLLVESGPADTGTVHQGFNRALDAVYRQVHETVDEFGDNDQTLWFTGHGLGGALAMLASARMYFETPNVLADGVYTFGQPRTCDHLLAGTYDEAFVERTFRFVNNNDVVARMPPGPVFHHVNDVRYFDAHGVLHERVAAAEEVTDSVAGLTGDLFDPIDDGVRDHFIDSYVHRLEQNLS